MGSDTMVAGIGANRIGSAAALAPRGRGAADE